MTGQARVVGLDLSLAGTGIALADGTTTTVKTRPKDGDRRLLQIQDAVSAAVKPVTGDRVDLVVVEDLVAGTRVAGITGMVHGIVRSLLLQAEVPYATVAPTTLKAYATGRGTADKTAVALARLYAASAEFADDNQCDAAWLRWAGLDWLGRPEVAVPQAQRDRLEKAAWPCPRVVVL